MNHIEKPFKRDLGASIKEKHYNWTIKVSEIQKPISKPEEPIHKKLIEVQEVSNGCRSRIKPKLAEGLEKAYKS
ncbi:22858_t:CDS:2 [Gigaspora rosea]|nr:22858_t:CDS:2 [Gigaspora rosea]